MKRILILAGTTEGRRLAEFLAGKPAEVIVSVATEYGKECMDGVHAPNIRVHTGRMNEIEMGEFLEKEQIGLAVDATHPFAVLVTENIRKACNDRNVEYLRCVRDWQKWEDTKSKVVRADSVKEAVQYLQGTTGKVLISTGSKELEEYTKLPDYQNRCFARVLSALPSVEASIQLGFEGKHLIAMQGPFSKELNLAMLRAVDASYFVTKESGKSGGFLEKVQAAKEAGATLIVIGRPSESGNNLEETKEILGKWLKNDQNR